MDIGAVIFDLDGTLIDNNEYHLRAWKEYLKKQSIEITDEEYKANFNGRTNKDVVEYIYKRKMTAEEAAPFYLEKEALYRQLYKDDIKPIRGLLDFLQEIKNAGIPMAIATSGIIPNIEFMFQHLPVEKYFTTVIHSGHINKGKPDPEIYIKAAEVLHVDRAKCVVFEDALVGILSGQGAGMKVVAITTTHPVSELNSADLVINNYTEINVSILQSLID